MNIPSQDRDMSDERSSRTARIAGCVLVTLAAVAGAGCGSDDAGKADRANTAITSSAAGGQELTIKLRDYTFEGVPQTITDGTTISVTNESAVEAHELIAFRLADSETRSLSELQALPPDQFGALFPGVPALGFAARPKEKGELVLGDGTLPGPGRYLLVCFIPTGADPDQVIKAIRAAAADPTGPPPQIDGGAPHLANGMIAEVVVTP